MLRSPVLRPVVPKAFLGEMSAPPEHDNHLPLGATAPMHGARASAHAGRHQVGLDRGEGQARGRPGLGLPWRWAPRASRATRHAALHTLVILNLVQGTRQLASF
jgi:hypothetical protein